MHSGMKRCSMSYYSIIIIIITIIIIIIIIVIIIIEKRLAMHGWERAINTLSVVGVTVYVFQSLTLSVFFALASM